MSVGNGRDTITVTVKWFYEWRTGLREITVMALEPGWCEYCGKFTETEPEHVVPRSFAPGEIRGTSRGLLHARAATVIAASRIERGQHNRCEIRGF